MFLWWYGAVVEREQSTALPCGAPGRFEGEGWVGGIVDWVRRMGPLPPARGECGRGEWWTGAP